MNNPRMNQKQPRQSSIPMGSRWMLSIAAAGLLASVGAGAADDRQITTEELVQMRSQARDMSQHDREQYRQEMDARLQSMSAEERQNLGLGRTGNADSDVRERMRSNEDNGRGRGDLARERSRAEAGSSDFGYGYEQRQSDSGRGGGMGQRGGGKRGR